MECTRVKAWRVVKIQLSSGSEVRSVYRLMLTQLDSDSVWLKRKEDFKMTSSATQTKEKVSIFSFLPISLLHPFFLLHCSTRIDRPKTKESLDIWTIKKTSLQPWGSRHRVETFRRKRQQSFSETVVLHME